MGTTLDDLVVRPIRLDERLRWCDLMRAHHYLGFDGIVGESLCYVATRSSEWVALTGWGWAALTCSSRDRWIGWSNIIRSHRLRLIANNVRFLILPHVRVKNLASRVLSLNLKRLSSDWEKFHGHPICLAETFVDPSRFEGTCYKASNWIFLGQTSGFGRSHQGYHHHGQPKRVFVYPLRQNVQKLLADPHVEDQKRKEKTLRIDIHRLPIEGRGGLMDVLKTMVDPRSRLGRRHNLISILAIAACAMLSGARGYQAIHQWSLKLTPAQRKKLQCYRPDLPSEPTIRRVLQSLDPDLFDRKIGDWLLSLVSLKNKAIALDGKTLRGSHDGSKKAVHLLSALLHEEKVVVAQKSVGEKTNEIPEVKNLLDPLNIEGAIVTLDALHTQEETARYLVRDKKADFLMTVKDNQEKLKEELSRLDYEAFPPQGVYQETSKAHGRLETRTISLARNLPHKTGFPFIEQVFKIERRRTIKNQETVETVFNITSLSSQQADAKRLLHLNRGHWSIENEEHYVRDTTFDEDRSRIRKKKGPQVMATLRNLVLSLLRLLGITNIARALREFAWESKNRVLRVIGIT